MVPRSELAPPEILRSLQRQLLAPRLIELSVEDAPVGYLGKDVECRMPVGGPVPTSGRPAIALIDGFAVTSDWDEGAVCPFHDARTRPSESQRDASPPPMARAPAAWRVEVGDIVPSECACVLPLDDVTVVGSRELRVDRARPKGYGLQTLPPTEAGARPRLPVVFPRGSHLDSRLRSVLLAAHVPRIFLAPPPSVAFALVGDELSEPGPSGDPESIPDLLGRAFDEGLRKLGLSPTGFGILADLPAPIDAALFRAKEREVELLVLAGGLGDGLDDRTEEGLVKAGALILSSARTSGLSGRLIHARVHGLDVIALGGCPSTALAQFDLFVRPAILIRMAAARRAWDWTLFRWRASAPPSLPGAGWRVLPARRRVSPTGEADLEAWNGTSPWLPIEPGQEGWAVFSPPEPAPPPTGQQAYFQPFCACP